MLIYSSNIYLLINVHLRIKHTNSNPPSAVALITVQPLGAQDLQACDVLDRSSPGDEDMLINPPPGTSNHTTGKRSQSCSPPSQQHKVSVKDWFPTPHQHLCQTNPRYFYRYKHSMAPVGGDVQDIASVSKPSPYTPRHFYPGHHCPSTSHHPHPLK